MGFILIQILIYFLISFAIISGANRNNYDKITKFIQTVVHQNFPTTHVNILQDPSTDQGTYSLNTLISAISNGPNLQLQSVSIANNENISASHFYHFQDWSWLNILILNGNQDEQSVSAMTAYIRSRATKDFFVDYTIIWQKIKYNPNMLSFQAFQKLKFKIVLKSNRDSLSFNSICFYCVFGDPALIRTRIGSKIPNKTELFQDFTRNFHGKRLRVTGGLGIPVLMDFAERANGEWDPVGGFMLIPIIFHLQQALNFTMKVSVFKTFGSQLSNGSFTGFVNELYHERAEIGMAGQSYDRIQAVHFLEPIYIDSVSFATSVPDSGFKWQAVFQAFTWDTWILYATLCFAAILPLYIWLGHVGRKHRRVAGNLKPFHAIWRGLQFVFRPTLEQDLTSGIIPANDSGRVLMIFWMITTLILGVAYKSKLTSLMVNPEIEDAPDSFEELANSKYGITLHHVGGALSKNIYSTPSTTFKRIGKRMALENSMYKCLDRTRGGGHGSCISYKCNIVGEINRNFTDKNGVAALRMAPANVFMTAGSYFLPKSALYKGSMGSVVIHQIAAGFGKYAVDKAFQTSLDQGKKWARERPDLFSWSRENGPAPLQINHLKAAFKLLLFGMAVGLMIFAVECVTHAWHNKTAPGKLSVKKVSAPKPMCESRMAWMR